jgi:hypothetical protein
VLRVGHGQHMVRPEGTARRARANGRGKTVRHRHDGVSAIAPRRCTVSSSLALGACGDDNGGVRTPAPRAVHLPRTLRPASPAAVRVAVAVVTVVLAVSTAAAVWRLGRRSVLTTGSAPVEAVTAGVLAMSAISVVALTTWRRQPRSGRPGGAPPNLQVVLAAIVPLLGGTVIGFATAVFMSSLPKVLLWQPRRLDAFLLSLCVSAWAWPSFVGPKMTSGETPRGDG